MKHKKMATPKRSSRNKQSAHHNSVAAQRHRLLECLQRVGAQGITTIQAREELDVISPAPRIFELRWNDGKNIVTQWDSDVTAQGKKHRVARYILIPGKWRGGEK